MTGLTCRNNLPSFHLLGPVHPARPAGPVMGGGYAARNPCQGQQVPGLRDVRVQAAGPGLGR